MTDAITQCEREQRRADTAEAVVKALRARHDELFARYASLRTEIREAVHDIRQAFEGQSEVDPAVAFTLARLERLLSS